MSIRETAASALPGFLEGMRRSDLLHSFTGRPLVMAAAAMTLIFVLGAVFAPVAAPQDPFDPARLDLMDSELPPVWLEGGKTEYLLGTDNQGRDILSVIMHGARISLLVGFASVFLSITAGVAVGLIAGFAGGWVEAVMMRLADIQLTVPAILIALMVNGLARVLWPEGAQDDLAIPVLIFAIGISNWPQYARVVRSGTLAEMTKDYVAAARIIGTPGPVILVCHVLPNILGPVLAIGTIGLALAIILEATLSFLGVGVPPTTPSLGTLIKVGEQFLFSGQWWITVFPSAALVLLALSVNLLGDWFRDALNPKLR